FGEPYRMVERNQRHSGAKLDPLGACRRCHRDNRWRAEGIARIMVFAEPDRMIAKFLGELGLLQDLVVVLRSRPMRVGVVVGVVEQSEFHHLASLHGASGKDWRRY